MDQRRAPLFEALKRHVARGYAGFHFPGHAGGRGFPRGLTARDLLRFDLTELPGLDDLHAPSGPIARAQELAAALYDADRTFFLVNGSTAGVEALFLAAAAPGEKVLLPRNVHRSVISGLILSGADPVYVNHPFSADYGFYLPPEPARIREALKTHPDLRAVFWTHPDYYGLVTLNPEVAEAIRGAGVPLLVDEAHGAHLPFHPDLPAPALKLGAAAAVQSMHKLGGAWTQASMLHLKGDGLSPERVGRALAHLQTSSPSYLLMASLDLARRQLALSGTRLLGRAVELAERLRRGLKVLGVVEVLETGPGEADSTKVVVFTRGLGLSGHRTAAILRRRYGVQVELAGVGHLLFVVGLGTRATDIDRALRAFRDLSRNRSQPNHSDLLRPSTSDFRSRSGHQTPSDFRLPTTDFRYEKVFTPRESWLRPARAVAPERAAGLVAAETVSLNPPGIPIVFPGEKLSPEVLEYILEIKQRGFTVQAADPGLATIMVHA